MTPRERLEKLRRLKELRDKAGGVVAAPEPVLEPVAGPDQSYTGSFLPLSSDAEGNVSFDPDAGVVGFAKRVITAPGEVLKGELDPNSPEGRARALETALAITPMSPASRGVPLRVPRPPKAPTAKALKEAARAGYNDPLVKGMEYAGSAVKTFADDVGRSLDEEGFIAELAPKTRALLEKLRVPPEGSVAKLSSVEAARRQFNRIAGSPDGTEATAANIVVRHIDEFLEQTNPVGFGPGPARGLPARATDSTPNTTGLAEHAAQRLRDARGNAGAQIRSGKLTGERSRAERSAAAANSGRNIGNRIRQRLDTVLNSPKQARGYSPDEIKAIEGVIYGTPAMNTSRELSNALGGGGGLGNTLLTGISAGLGASIAGWPGAAIGGALPSAGGRMARAIANALTRRELRMVDEMVRMRSPLYRSMIKNAPGKTITSAEREAIVRALLAAPAMASSAKLPNTIDELQQFYAEGGA